jgi:hypothetical protein
MAKKKLRSMRSAEDRRRKQNTAGSNRGKTRPDVPSTPENKKWSGKARASVKQSEKRTRASGQGVPARKRGR